MGKSVVVVSDIITADTIRRMRPDLTVRVHPLAAPGEILIVDIGALDEWARPTL